MRKGGSSMMIVAVAKLEKVPDNCWECEYYGCSLPTKTRQPEYLKKAYKNKRHPGCPLRLVDTDNLHVVGKG